MCVAQSSDKLALNLPKAKIMMHRVKDHNYLFLLESLLLFVWGFLFLCFAF